MLMYIYVFFSNDICVCVVFVLNLMEYGDYGINGRIYDKDMIFQQLVSSVFNEKALQRADGVEVCNFINSSIFIYPAFYIHR